MRLELPTDVVHSRIRASRCLSKGPSPVVTGRATAKTKLWCNSVEALMIGGTSGRVGGESRLSRQNSGFKTSRERALLEKNSRTSSFFPLLNTAASAVTACQNARRSLKFMQDIANFTLA